MELIFPSLCNSFEAECFKFTKQVKTQKKRLKAT